MPAPPPPPFTPARFGQSSSINRSGDPPPSLPTSRSNVPAPPPPQYHRPNGFAVDADAAGGRLPGPPPPPVFPTNTVPTATSNFPGNGPPTSQYPPRVADGRRASRPPHPSQQQQQQQPSRLNRSQVPRPSVGEVGVGDTAPQPLVDNSPGSPKTPEPAKATYRPTRAKHGGAPPPPPPSSKFVCVAGDNCSPRYVRSTMHKLPRSKKDLDATNVPLAISVTPLASRRHGHEPRVPEVDFAKDDRTENPGPPRCSHCRAYINCFVETWGRRPRKNRTGEVSVWTCPLCNAETELPEWYVDGGIVRESPSIDFVLTSGYRVRPVQKPFVAFAVDASFGDLGFLAERIRECCRTSDNSESFCCKYGLVFFAKSSIYFVSTAKQDGDANLVAVTDVDDPFCPLAPDEWLFETSQVDRLLQSLSQLAAAAASAADDDDNNVCVAALAAAAHGLETVGGKVCLVTSSSPTRGLGTDFASHKTDEKSSRDALAARGSGPASFFAVGEREAAERKGRLQPRSLEELSRRLSAQQIGVDVICVEGSASNNSRMDGTAAALGRLCEATGGRLYYHASMRGDAALSKNLRRVTSWLSYQSRGTRELTVGSAHECVLKVRCSRGLRVARYYGSGIGGDIVEVLDETDATRNVVCCDAAQTFTCDLEYEDGSKNDDEVAYVQAALLYSDALTGRRLVRVHTLELSYSTNFQAVFKSLDTETVFATLTKRAQIEAGAGGRDPFFLAHAFGKKKQKGDNDGRVAAKRWTTARDGVVDACVLINQSYRTLCVVSSGKNSGQLILPESVKLLPLLCLGALKGPLLRDQDAPEERTHSPPSDDFQTTEVAAARRPVNVSLERAALLSRSLAAPPDEIVALAYPRLYELPRAGEDVVIRTVPTSSESLFPDRAYLLDAGHVVYLYVGDDVDDSRTKELLTVFFDADNPDWLLSEDVAAFYDGSTQRSNVAAPFHPEAELEVDRVRALVAMLFEYRSICPQLRHVSGQNHLHIFWNHLVEDQTYFGASYTDFLCSIHKEIQARMQPVDRSYM